MKTVTIPTTMNPYRVIINSKEYTYEAGATVEVPDEVAEEIENSLEAAEELVKPAPLPNYQPDWNQTNETAADYIKNKPFGEQENVVVPIDKKYLPEELDGLILPSSTEGSTKKFRITVADDGEITAAEIAAAETA